MCDKDKDTGFSFRAEPRTSEVKRLDMGGDSHEQPGGHLDGLSVRQGEGYGFGHGTTSMRMTEE